MPSSRPSQPHHHRHGTEPYHLEVEPFFNGIAPQRDIEFDTVFTCEDAPFWSGDIQGHLKVKRNTTGFVVTGTLAGTLHTACDVCAEPFDQTVALAVNEKFVLNQFTSPSKTEQELGQADFYEEIDEHDIVDFRDLARQVIETDLMSVCLCHTHQASRL
jgi:hypothetical protein